MPATPVARWCSSRDDLTSYPLSCSAPVVSGSADGRAPAVLPGDLVAVVGVGGLGHLGVQFAAKLGFEVVAVSRGCRPWAARRWCWPP